MTKVKARILIAVCVILLLAVFGCKENNAASNAPPKADAPDNEIVKLVYVGTNETLSEALYHLDLQDGKLDEPHIVASIVGGDKPKVLRFIDKNNKVVKELSFARNYDLDIIDNKYVMATEKHVRPGENYINAFSNYYYDFKGDLLWERKINWSRFMPSPDGKIIVEAPQTVPQAVYEFRILNDRGEILNKYNYEKHAENIYFSGAVFFPPDSKYFLLDFKTVEMAGGPKPKHQFVIFDKSANLISSFETERASLGDIVLDNNRNIYCAGAFGKGGMPIRGCIIYEVMGEERFRYMLPGIGEYYLFLSSNQQYLSLTYPRENEFRIYELSDPIKQLSVVPEYFREQVKITFTRPEIMRSEVHVLNNSGAIIHEKISGEEPNIIRSTYYMPSGEKSEIFNSVPSEVKGVKIFMSKNKLFFTTNMVGNSADWSEYVWFPIEPIHKEIKIYSFKE